MMVYGVFLVHFCCHRQFYFQTVHEIQTRCAKWMAIFSLFLVFPVYNRLRRRRNIENVQLLSSTLAILNGFYGCFSLCLQWIVGRSTLFGSMAHRRRRGHHICLMVYCAYIYIYCYCYCSHWRSDALNICNVLACRYHFNGILSLVFVSFVCSFLSFFFVIILGQYFQFAHSEPTPSIPCL